MSNQIANDSVNHMLVNGFHSSDVKASGGGSGGGRSWLVAMASAMGNLLGKKAARLVELSNKLETLGNKSTGSNQKPADEQKNAQEFQKVMSEFQAESQLFGMISQAASTAIKSVGEGMSSVARKS